MAACRPVILAIDGVIREVVEQAQAGICVPPGDPEAIAEAIKTLVSHPAEAQKMGCRGRDYVVEHFDRQTVALRLETILCDTANKD